MKNNILKRPNEWRLIPRIEKNPAIVKFAEGYLGKSIIIVIFLTILDQMISLNGNLPFVIGMAICTFAGEHRRLIITATMIIGLYLNPGFNSVLLNFVAAKTGTALSYDDLQILKYKILIVAFLLSFLTLYGMRKFREVWLFKRPVLSLLILYFLLLILANFWILSGASQLYLWTFICAFGFMFWFLAYGMKNQTSKNNGPLVLEMGFIHPFWNLVDVQAFATNFYKYETKTPTEFAISQLKGIKLLLWCLILVHVSNNYTFFTRHYLGIPAYEDVFLKHVKGISSPIYICWGSLIVYFFKNLMGIAIWGHKMVACARMCGFLLLRSTYRPLEAKSIAEFWNRYLFYFKEILADFFFFPTFLRCFKEHTKLRIAFATFMATFVGNIIFHFMKDLKNISDIGMLHTIIGYQSYFVYCSLLTTGIVISQMNQINSKTNNVAKGWLRRNLLPPISVCLFYCLIHVFDDLRYEYTLTQHFNFLFHLFGLR